MTHVLLHRGVTHLDRCREAEGQHSGDNSDESSQLASHAHALRVVLALTQLMLVVTLPE
ncbi:hypothetical protein OG607_20590 [Streptomyces sp. NBC_01537]|uniref:hypothetical protein n=1 Tax=Streptomyces sp. NBC_01537 TaxID=2903896 RepID=UPI00386E84C3